MKNLIYKLIRYIKYIFSIRSTTELKKYLNHLWYTILQKIDKSDKVSVVIPVWDRTHELEESISSILKQSYHNIELILVTDGSPKETIEVIKKYEDNPRVKVFYYYNNSGTAVRGRNKAIREATGKYLAFQDSDDIADRDRIKNSVKFIKKYNVDGVYGGWRAMVDGTRKDTGLKNKQEVFSPDCDLEMMKETCVPCQSTVMIKTDVLRKLGGLKEKMRYREDHELWTRFMYKGYKFKAIPKVLTNLRIHKGNAELLFKANDKKWYKELQKEYKLDTEIKPKIAYIIPSTGVGGGLGVIIQHVNRLLQRGYDTLLISEDDKTEIDWATSYVQIVPLHTNKKYLLENIDLLVATGWSTVKYLKDIDAKRKLYFIQSDERRFFEEKDSHYIKEVEETYKSNYEFFTMAKWIQKWLKKEFNKDSYYVPNGLDTKIFYKDKPIEKKSKKYRILLEGPLSIWFKGMVDAYYACQGLDCEMWIVSGDGKPPSYWKYDNFFEHVHTDTMRRIYSSCDFLLKMSRVESFCLPALEAMACGCIPIITNFTGSKEFIKNNYNGKIIEIGNTVEAANAIKELINNPNLRKNLIKNGEKTVKEWNWERSIDMLENVIRKDKPVVYYDEKTEDYSYTEYIRNYL